MSKPIRLTATRFPDPASSLTNDVSIITKAEIEHSPALSTRTRSRLANTTHGIFAI